MQTLFSLDGTPESGAKAEKQLELKFNCNAPPDQQASDVSTRILVVEDRPGDAMLITMALSECACRQFSFRHATTLKSALGFLAEETFDIALLDLSLPDAEDLTAVRRVRTAAPTLPIVVLTGSLDPSLPLRALAVGAQDYLLKNEISGPLVSHVIQNSIRSMAVQVGRGGRIERSEDEPPAMKLGNGDGAPDQLARMNLTPAELRVISLIKGGLSTKEIARILGISPFTVNIHRKHIRKKIGIEARSTNLHSHLMTFT
ncbi:MAG: response regulator transcription factor [Phaeospirillum sp.]|nr:response regulator transcription factor [Phaeospirillum sp.]